MMEELMAALRDHKERSPTPLAHLMQSDDLWTAKKIAACCEPTLCGKSSYDEPSKQYFFQLVWTNSSDFENS